MDDYPLIGERLRQARTAAGLSRREAVERMAAHGYQLSSASLKDFEDGRRLNLRSLFQLAEVLDVPRAALLGVGEARSATLGELRRSVEGSQLLPIEREFLFAALNHIERLRTEGRAVASDGAVNLSHPATSAQVRRALLELLGRGGAFSLKELLTLPLLQGVPEHLVHREAQDLARKGILQAVTHRPLRFCLRSERLDEAAD